MQPLRHYTVLLPWDINDKDEGDYKTTVEAKDPDEAVRIVAKEMADTGEKYFDSDDEKEDFINELADHGGEVEDTMDVFIGQMEPLFGLTGTINVDALRLVLEENKNKFVTEPTRSPKLN
jgi:hypothetical protein